MLVPARVPDCYRRRGACAALAILVLRATIVSAADPVGPPECDARTTDCRTHPGEPGNWADTSYRFVTSRGDSLAQWVDSFFYAPNTDAESADSVLRLLGEYQWDQEDGGEEKLRLRGKVDLPALDKRLSLVFSEDDDERRDVVPESQLERSDVGLVYRVTERARSLVYLSVGTNASLEFRSSLRMRYDYPLAEDWNLRLSERLYFRDQLRSLWLQIRYC